MLSRGRLMVCCSLIALTWARAAETQTNPSGQSAPTSAPAPATKPKATRTNGTSRSDPGARAAPTNQDTSAASGKAIGETIVVTGSRRKDTIQRTPEAITAFTDERRNLIGVTSGQDIVNLTPSASLQGEYLTVRGVGRFEDPGQGLDPGIAVNIDGVYTASPAYLSQPDFLTDRVEILRGPQSVQGHTAAGGEVDLYSRRPTDAYHADIRFGGTTLDEGYSNLAFSGPITDNLKFRVSEAYDVTGGPGQDNISAAAQNSNKQPGAGDSLILEAQLEWTPTDDIDIWARYQNFQQHYNGFYGVGAGVGQLSPYLPSGAGPAPIFANPFFGLAPNPAYGLSPRSNPSILDPFKTDENTIGHGDIHDDHTITINATDDLGWATLKYVGNYSQYVTQTLLDVDYGSRQYFSSPGGTILPPGRLVPASYTENSPQSKHWGSNEISLSSNGLDRFRWLVGAYQYEENYVTGFNIEDPLAAYLSHPVSSVTTLALAAPNPSRSFYSQTTKLATETQAAYGQVDYDFTPTVRGSAAFRYDWDERQGSDNYRTIYDVYGFYGDDGAPKVGLDLTPKAHAASAQGAYHNQTGKAGLEWHPDKSLIAYASVSRGYEPGGFRLGAFSQIPSVKTETLMDYEIGVKKTWGSFLIFDASGFYYQYNNLQVPISIAVPTAKGDIFQLALTNAQRARSYGTELETVVSPTSDLHLTFLYSYLNTAFEEFQNPISGQGLVDTSTNAVYESLRGNPIPYSPKNKFTFSPQYTMHFKNADLSLSAVYSYQGSEYDGVFKNPNYRARQYENLSFRALYQPKQTHWTAIIYARNVTNSTQFVYHAPSLFYPSLTAYTVNPPFIFGGEIQYRF